VLHGRGSRPTPCCKIWRCFFNFPSLSRGIESVFTVSVPVEQLGGALNRGTYELVGADERDVCRPRTASKQLSSVAAESLANERNRVYRLLTGLGCGVRHQSGCLVLGNSCSENAMDTSVALCL
jgi:hypothetical protein